MTQTAGAFTAILAQILPFPNHGNSPELSVDGDRLKIKGRHTTRFQHIIDDLGVKVNGHEVEDAGFETKISGENEEVTIVLPFEPKAGDVITVDTAVHSFGSKKITLRVE